MSEIVEIAFGYLFAKGHMACKKTKTYKLIADQLFEGLASQSSCIHRLKWFI